MFGWLLRDAPFSRTACYGAVGSVIVATVALGPLYAPGPPDDAKPLTQWQPWADCVADAGGFERVPVYVVERRHLRPDSTGAYYVARHKIALAARDGMREHDEWHRRLLGHELAHAAEDRSIVKRTLTAWRAVYSDANHGPGFDAKVAASTLALEGCMAADGHRRLFRLDDDGVSLRSLRSEHRSDCLQELYERREAAGTLAEADWDRDEALCAAAWLAEGGTVR